MSMAGSLRIRDGWGMVLGCVMVLGLSAAPGRADGPYRMDAIQNDPLDARVLKSSVQDGLVTEEVEFTSDLDRDGKPVRIFGILAYPEGARALPAVLWGQGGMSPAGVWAPHLYAKKGYVGFNITMPHKQWPPWDPLDTEHPADANLVRFTIAHLRAITYLVSRPEVNPDRIGMGGSSYGGYFATMVTGLDPRIKAGMSFFSGGCHDQGTHLPQFTGLKTREALDVFRQVADGATALRSRAVPFLWGVAANDHWFQLPAVMATYAGTAGDGKRMAIAPLWAHGFDEAMDNQLFDWFDVHLKGTRPPYHAVSALTVTNRDGRLLAEWNWTPQTAVRKADLVVSWGRVLPWHGWIHRYHHVVAATVSGNVARAAIPVPDPGLEILAYGNTVDEGGVTISTMPVAVMPSKSGILKPAGGFVINAYPLGGFEAADTDFLGRLGELPGTAATNVFREGRQSLRFANLNKPVALKLFHVSGKGHVLTAWIRAEPAAEIRVRVAGVFPQDWDRPAVKVILASMPGSLPVPDAGALPSFEQTVKAGPDWTEVRIDCPWKGVAIEGYRLELSANPAITGACWIDSVRFEPRWL